MILRAENKHDDRPVICQVLHSLAIGGAEILAAGLARELSDRYRFVFACLDDEVGVLGDEFEQRGVPMKVFYRQPGIDWKCSFRLAQFFREHRVQIVHAHQYTPFFQSLLARLRFRYPPIVFTEHGRHFPDSRSPKRVAVNRALLRSDDRLIGVGESVRRALVENEGLPEHRTETIYNGVPLEKFLAVRGDAELRLKVRNELRIAPNEFAIVQVARLNALKDHATAIRTLKRLLDHGVPAKLILVGDGEERSQLERFVTERSLGHAITFLGARNDIPQLLSCADAFLLSSISEGIPLTLIEAMGAGVPIVSTDVGGISEVIEHGTSGLLAPARDDELLAAHLRLLWQDSECRTQLADRGCQRAVERFSLDQMHQQYVNVYEQLLGRAAASRSSRTTDGLLAGKNSRGN
ncbi:MAG: glycosyltransferase [Rhodopirellula sp.]|nr:glycosyltransferase [Rhodopirellula sp.]